MPIVRFGEFARLRKDFIRIDDRAGYKRARVQLHWRGIVVRDQVEGAAIKTKDQQVAKAGELLVAEIDAKVGGVGIVPAEVDCAIVSSHYFLFEIEQRKCLQPWLDFFIRSGALEDQIAARGSTNCAAIRPQHVLNLEMPLPPIPEQRRIVARIEELSAKIEEARTLRHQAAEEAEALTAVTSREFISGYWPQARLEDVCPVITDGTHQTPRYTDDGAIFLSAQNVKPFRFMPEKHRKVSAEDFRSYTSRNKAKRGDVLLTRVGAGIGEAAMVDQDIEFAIYVSLALIRTDSTRLSPEFLVHWLNSPAGRSNSDRETLGRGTSQGNLNLKLLRGVVLPVPPLREQRRIVAELDAFQAKFDALKKVQEESAAELDALVPSILSKAFSGAL